MNQEAATEIRSNTFLARLQVSPWLVWGLGAAFFFVEYFARVSPSVMVHDLMRDFAVNAVALGSLSAFFYYAYVGMQVPVGMLVDRYGAHRLLTLTALICAVGSIIFSQAKTIFFADIGRLLMGFGASFAFVGSLKLAAVWFLPTRFGLLAGLTQAIGMLGAAVGEAPMAIVVNALGWRDTMFLIAVIFLILAVLIWIYVRDFPTDYPRHKIKTDQQTGLLKSLKIVLKNKESWINALYVGMVYAPTAAFAELWGVSFLKHAYDMTTTVAAGAIGCILLGWGVGGPLVGWLSDYVRKRRPIMLGSALSGLFLLSFVLYVPLPYYLIYGLLFLYGISNTGVAISYALASEINPRYVAGTSMAFANMASVIVGAIFQPLIGWFLVLQWNGLKINGVPDYSVTEFRIALLILPIFLLIGFISAWYIRETHCRPIEERPDY